MKLSSILYGFECAYLISTIQFPVATGDNEECEERQATRHDRWKIVSPEERGEDGRIFFPKHIKKS